MKKKKDSGIPSFGRILEAWDVIITTENRERNGAPPKTTFLLS